MGEAAAAEEFVDDGAAAAAAAAEERAGFTLEAGRDAFPARPPRRDADCGRPFAEDAGTISVSSASASIAPSASDAPSAAAAAEGAGEAATAVCAAAGAAAEGVPRAFLADERLTVVRSTSSTDESSDSGCDAAMAARRFRSSDCAARNRFSTLGQPARHEYGSHVLHQQIRTQGRRDGEETNRQTTATGSPIRAEVC